MFSGGDSLPQKERNCTLEVSCGGDAGAQTGLERQLPVLCTRQMAAVTARPRSPHTHPEKTVPEWESLGDQVTLTLIPDLLTLRLEVSCLPPAASARDPGRLPSFPCFPDHT